MSAETNSGYPPPAFHFRVVFAGSQQDTSFQEVSGIGARMEMEPYQEGGENRFTHQLPKGAVHDNLVLKRGIADADSPLVSWCKEVLEGGLAAPITTRTVVVNLLNESHEPLRSWSVERAYPVKWEVQPFHSTKNEVAIETIELSYAYANRTA